MGKSTKTNEAEEDNTGGDSSNNLDTDEIVASQDNIKNVEEKSENADEESSASKE